MHFPNYAGRDDVDEELAAELTAAGITVHRVETLRHSRTAEIGTAVIGELHGWGFRRAWCYWVAEGPGLPLAFALPLHLAHGRDVRVDGHCAAPSPLEHFNGFACGHYHVDTTAGLKALAGALTACAAAGAALRGL